MIAKFDEELNYKNLGVPVHQVKQFAPIYSFGCAISSKEFIAAGLIDLPKRSNEIDMQWKHMISYYAMSSEEVESLEIYHLIMVTILDTLTRKELKV